MQLEMNRDFVKEFVGLLERLVEDRPKSEKLDDYQKLKGLKSTSSNPHQLFRLDRMIFDPFIALAIDFYDFNDLDVLRGLRRELLGEVPYATTYMLQYNFSELLGGDFVELYTLCKTIWAGLEAHMTELEGLEEFWPAYDALDSRLYELITHQLQPNTVAELLATQLGRQIRNFPKTNAETFDGGWRQESHPIAAYSSILTPETGMIIQKKAIRDYITKLLSWMSGEAVLFVDITIMAQGQGFLFNLR